MYRMKSLGLRLLGHVEDLGLMIIGLLTVVAIGVEIHSMIKLMQVTLADLLLMFIYLEVLAMVSLYLKSGKLPVRMPLYIVIVAIARYMALDMKNMDTERMLGMGAAMLLVTVCILVIRYGQVRFPHEESDHHNV